MADDQEYYGYYYGAEDEDRGLLDPAWERQQRKVCLSHALFSRHKFATQLFVLKHLSARVVLTFLQYIDCHIFKPKFLFAFVDIYSMVQFTSEENWKDY